MFKFNFDVDEDDSSDVLQLGESSQDRGAKFPVSGDQQAEDVSREVPLDELISALPHTISYSPLSIPLASQREVVISRRDLFDARFQLISAEDDSDAERNIGRSGKEFVDAPSDLVPGVYEGGLKTWECSIDLVDCMDSIYGADVAQTLRGKRLLELGCGTAVPSLYLLQSLFYGGTDSSTDIHVHLQDYNELVLRLVTLPNIVLAWYMSPASSSYRSAMSDRANAHSESAESQDRAEEEPLPPADPTQPGELPLTPALLAAFLGSLRAYRVRVKFFSGAWTTLDVGMSDRGPYDILLTSETVYRTASLESLVDLMGRATAGRRSTKDKGDDLSSDVATLSLAERERLSLLAREPYLCLVAAKMVYFGVGGGVSEFIEAVERSRYGGKAQTIWDQSRGIRRSVMRVVWETM